MKNVGIAAVVGTAAILAVMAAYFTALYAGAAVTPGLLLAIAAVLAFGMSTAGFMLAALRDADKKNTTDKFRETRLATLNRPPAENERPSVRPIPASAKAVKLVVKPDTVPNSLLSDCATYKEQEVFVTIRKTSEKAMFNPVYLKEIFKTLKDNDNYTSVLLRDENSEYAGYIPGTAARQKFTGSDAETQISKRIIETLQNPDDSTALRAIGGIAANDWISDQATVAEAAKRMARDQLAGLVVLQGGRHRRPVAVVYLEDLAAAIMARS
jgi:hypothetical protein